jgi:hypothetical protein
MIAPQRLLAKQFDAIALLCLNWERLEKRRMDGAFSSCERRGNHFLAFAMPSAACAPGELAFVALWLIGEKFLVKYRPSFYVFGKLNIISLCVKSRL